MDTPMEPARHRVQKHARSRACQGPRGKCALKGRLLGRLAAAHDSALCYCKSHRGPSQRMGVFKTGCSDVVVLQAFHDTHVVCTNKHLRVVYQAPPGVDCLLVAPRNKKAIHCCTTPTVRETRVGVHDSRIHVTRLNKKDSSTVSRPAVANQPAEKAGRECLPSASVSQHKVLLNDSSRGCLRPL